MRHSRARSTSASSAATRHGSAAQGAGLGGAEIRALLLRAIRAIRRMMVGRGTTESDIQHVLGGASSGRAPDRPMWHLSIVEGDGVLQLRQLDGWLINVVDRAYRAACRAVRSPLVFVAPISRRALEKGTWASTGEARVPSLVIARKYLRRCGQYQRLACSTYS